MKTNYVCVTETGIDYNMVGVIGFVNDEELNRKLHIAICEHFDTGVIIPDVMKDEIGYGKSIMCQIDGYRHELWIEPTWLY